MRPRRASPTRTPGSGGARVQLSQAALHRQRAAALLARPVDAGKPRQRAGRTRWVDDDGKVGTISCSGTRTAYKTIQKGVNAAGTGDIVKVFPGTYVGPVTIQGARTGLILRSVSNLGATIKAVDAFGPARPGS
ncbi:MAG: hypothetical protein LH650_10945 [Chloroflexi bacterium]|nr:hypothetical protein [Chloroflexota bacterium]